ncbi:MAG: 4-hydroxy-tetrahydrodipicolinate reductase [Treponema sp.]|nr:4-hydroxy-tetrahydrodipicolinate reductase [Treponema sp.]
MKIALIGYGKMGRLLEARLLERGHQVVAVVDPFITPGTGGCSASGELASGAVVYASLEDALKGKKGRSLADADAALEFSLPDKAVGNLLFLATKKIPVVTGTTGWYEKLPEVRAAVNAAGSSLVWSSNFSLGVNLFYRIAAYAAKLADPFKEYDVAGFETHHNNKADSPSGTAKTLVERVLAQMTRKKKAVYQMLDRKPAADELHYASLRVGSVPGVHSLIFDSAADTIEITHSARSREGLAAGAVLAVEWLGAKKRTGVFTVDDVLADILPQS